MVIDKVINEYKQEILNKRNEINRQIEDCQREKQEIEIVINKYRKKFFNKSKWTWKIGELENNIKIIDEKIIKLQEELELLENEIANLDNKDYIINRVVKENPNLLKSKSFIAEITEYNPLYIIFDKTDDSEIYKKFLISIQNELSQLPQEYFQAYNLNIIKENISQILEELSHPKKVDDDKYKIPHRFLFDEIRKKIIDVCNTLSLSTEEVSVEKMLIKSFTQSLSYFDDDGMYSKKYGETIEKLFSDDNYYLGRADVSENNIDEIMHNGYILNYNSNISANFFINSDHSFFKYLEASKIGSGYRPGRDYTVIVLIPKYPTESDEIIVSNEREFENTYKKYNNQFLNPKFIIGYIPPNNDKGQFKFVDNPYSVEQRTKYNYSSYAYAVNQGQEHYIKSGMNFRR